MAELDTGDGCGFLEPEELERALEGGLDAGRLAAFERHVEQGCGACALLAADLELFAEVLAGGASEAERAEFDSRSELLSRRLAREVARRGGAGADRAAEPAARRPASFVRRWGYAVAAVLVLAIGFGVLRFSGPEGIAVLLPDGGRLVEAPMAFSLPPTLRGEADAGAVWREAGRAYEAGRYDEAAGLLDEIGDADPGAADAALYRGVALLAAGDAAAARRSLALARERAERDDLPTGSIDWHAALAALVEGDVEAARRDLERVRDAGGAYAERAAALLERL